MFGQVLFLRYTSELVSILENRLISNADDTSLMAVVPSPCVKVSVTEPLIRDLGSVSECCFLWGMKFNASKTKTTIVSMAPTLHPQSPPINYWQTCDEGV